MNLSVENIQAVHWRFMSFVGNIKIHPEERYLHLCRDQQNDFEFYNVCHRATLEIENLYLHEKYDFIQDYFTKFQNLQNKLESIISHLEKKWLANQINIAKVYIDKVFVCLKEFNSRHEKQRENNDKATLTNPFKDEKTAELFEYIVQNWNYDKQQKWADIWNAINKSANYKAPYQNEYQSYIIKRFKYTGRFQYSYWKDKAPPNRNQINLIDLIKNFSKK
jgi:hypothetical protein